VRYNANGTLDTRFGKEGVAFTDLESDYKENPGPSCLALQPDGKIVAGGSALGSSGQDFMVMRYLGSDQWIPKWW
jgi:hypothetical protein